MKKRKQPVALIIVLVLCGTVAFGINAAMSGLFRGIGAPQPEAVGEARKTNETSESIAASAAKSLGDLKKISSQPKTPVAATQASPAGPGARRPAGMPPLMAMPKANAYKPKPNDASIGTQWYTSDARKYGN